MGEQRSDWHHYRPVLHLRHFADGAGLVWAFDHQGRFAPRQDIPKRLGAEYFLYAPGRAAQDPRSDEAEKWFATNVDGPAATPMGSLASGAIPSGRPERHAIARFIALQDLRTPSTRDLVLPALSRGLKEEWPTVARETLIALGDEPTEADVSELAAAYRADVTNAAWLGFIAEHFNAWARRVNSMHWTLVAAPPNYEWITNDVGIVKFRSSWDNAVPFAPGWATGDRWLFPLSPRYAMALGVQAAGMRGEARPRWLKAVNRRQVEDAVQTVYARRRFTFIERRLRVRAAT
ncbi:MAG: DUF4238 domain-containing protein [Gemmatimonadetes bacterium]|nr:DUF4238 domain-containing protein [Gemmatimonadota bacterium]